MSSQQTVEGARQIPQQLQVEYGHQVVKYIAQMSNLSDFHGSASFLLANSKHKLEEHKRGAVEQVTAHADMTPVFSAIASATGADPSNWLAQEMAKTTSANSVLLIDASSIVFAHSLLEAHLYFLCDLCFRAFPKDWEQFVTGKELKPMTVGELLSKSQTELLSPIWKSELARLERTHYLQKLNDCMNWVSLPPAQS